MSLEFWYMLPVSIVVATTAMASGVEGATFFAPIFLILLGLPPEVAIGTGLITEVFGFGSGLYAYWRKRLIDYRLGRSLLVTAIPLAVFGTWLSGVISPDLLRGALGVGLIVVGSYFLLSGKVRTKIEDQGKVDSRMVSSPRENACIQTRLDGVICYPVPARLEGQIWSGIGAMFMGMVSTGLGQMNDFFLLKRSEIPAGVAVATSVFVVAITALVASSGHVIRLSQSSPEALETVMSLVIFTIPGVIIGGQIGPLLANRLSQAVVEKGLGVLFVFIGFVMLLQAFAVV